MKRIFSAVLVLLICGGAYRFGKTSADTWWKSETARREKDAADQALAFEKSFKWDLALAREIHTGLYIGCGGAGPVYIKNTNILVKRAVDYAIWVDSCDGPITLDRINFENIYVKMSPMDESKAVFFFETK